MQSLLVLLVLALTAGGVLREGPLRIRYWAGGEPLARHIAALVRGFTRLPGLPGNPLDQGPPVEIDLAPDPVRWDSLTGGGAPIWGAGIAVPAEGRIVLPGYGSRADPAHLGEILRHELAHIGLHRFLGPARIPRWFDEGYATWASGGMDAGSAWMLRLAFLLHRAPPLDSLELTWPVGETRARLAYLLSASAVALLAERAGDHGLSLLFTRWRKVGSLDLALRGAFGITLGQFERQWRHEVGRRYAWTVLLSDTFVFWLLISPGLILIYLVRRRRDRARLARLRDAELPDQPAWWLETGQPGAAPPDHAPESPQDPPDPQRGPPPA